MSAKMLINAVDADEYRVAIIKDGFLDGYYIETTNAEEKIGNIYKGVVQQIEPSLQACFVDYGSDKNGFLPVNEIHPEYYLDRGDSSKGGGNISIEKLLKKGQELLVQVRREMPGKKGAQLTTYLSFASRYLILMPGGTGGISKKIEDEEERQRLKSIMSKFRIPEGIGYIVRTAADKMSKKDLLRDLNRLLRMWKKIKQNVKKAPPLTLVHKEQDVCLRTLRDYFTTEITEILVDDRDTYLSVKDYMKIFSPRHQQIIKPYKGKQPLFAHYEIEKQIESIYSRRVQLKSGGSIIIETTEALISIDVNSGRGRGGKDIESTAYNTNVEAAIEIARQLRLRDIGGLLIVDFIDMRDKEHIREIERLMREETKRDRAKIDMSHISKYGLMEMSRQRLRPSLESRSYEMCRHCQGRGLVLSVGPASVSVLRQISTGVSKKGVTQVRGVLPEEVATYLQNRKRRELALLESRYGIDIILQGDSSLSPGAAKLEFVKENGTNDNGKT
ncbi:S1 RNA binding domain protein [uncultured Desulfobacterium sp.]|uniref:Ribonuclease G n=1 Tax=uncultured Desulfobacterium sp. TaxID=201089 RepID=A0A445MU65_9BACT|nr:S1 RNA binding domain protein [uncultured Desulfobacterium sp.]